MFVYFVVKKKKIYTLPVNVAVFDRYFLILGVPRPVLWLVGHSYLYHAAQRASLRPGGLQLGFTQADILWRGVRGLRWIRVLVEVVAVSKLVHGPAVLVLHAAGNDPCSVRVSKLISVIRADFDHFASFFPGHSTSVVRDCSPFDLERDQEQCVY